MRSTIVLAGLLCALALGGAPAAAEQFIERFASRPWQTFPGGRYKASTSKTLPGTTMAGALAQLNAGGVRELHWHDTAEWAMVIEGTCIATAVDQGSLRPSDSWNFTAGDVWYFPANVPHAVVGGAPRGCTFVTAFNSPDFDELRSFSASSWLATVPVDTLAQALGAPKAAAQRILDANKGKPASFMTQGKLSELATQPPSLSVQFPQNIHRFSLLQNTHEVDNRDGSYINMVDVTRFPVATDLSGAIVRIAPGGMRQLHWHLNFDEWQFVINGTVEVGVFTEPGKAFTGTLGAGDVGFAPRGSGHYVRNTGRTDAHVVLIFNADRFTNVDASNFLGSFPPSWTASSLRLPTAAMQSLDFGIAGFAPSQGRSPSAAPTKASKAPPAAAPPTKAKVFAAARAG